LSGAAPAIGFLSLLTLNLAALYVRRIREPVVAAPLIVSTPQVLALILLLPLALQFQTLTFLRLAFLILPLFITASLLIVSTP
jgi:hypothetical protein